jgi:long-subunit fatty acid transport protein
MKSTRLILAFTTLALLGVSSAVAGEVTDRIWFGGGIGVGFGDVDFVTLEPHVGFEATDKLSVGLGLIYRYSDDPRFDPDLKTSDYGANLFARYSIVRSFFGQAEYEYLEYETRRFDGSKDRDQYHSLRAGLGYSQSLGGHSSLYTVALYNFNYDDNDSPYDDPWTYRVGVAFGF